MFFDFREGGRERNRETLIGCLLLVPWLGTEPATQVCALTGDQTYNLLVYGRMLHPADLPGQGHFLKSINVKL